jgi:cobalt-zinc-cadmium efflux system outer membrane protein
LSSSREAFRYPLLGDRMKLLIAVIVVAAGVFAAASARAGDAEKELRLSQAIDEALKNNPEIRVLQNKLQSARARGNQSTYLDDPELNLEAWGIPLNQPASIRSSNPIVVGLRQKVPFFGKRALKSEIAGSEVRMAEEELRAKQVEVVAKVKNAYADYFLAGKSIEIAKGHLELIRQVSLTAENLYKVGKAPQQDVIKALLEQTNLLNRLNMAERELETTKARLNTLLNRHPGAQVGPPAELSLVRLLLSFDDLERLAIENNPELQGMEQNVRRSEKVIELAQRNQKYPDFMLGLQYWVAPDQKQKHMYTPMVSLTIPFSPWSKGKHDYEVEEAMADRQATKSQHDAMKNTALLAVREMFTRARAAEKSVSFYQDGLLPQAQQAFEATVAAYQTGQVNFVTMLDAQRTIREARLGYYKALVEHEQSIVDIEKAVGVTLPRR